MTTLIHPASNFEEQRVILPSVTWRQYESLLATLGDYPGLRLIYLEGTLEIFMPSPQHEMIKKVIARLLEKQLGATMLAVMHSNRKSTGTVLQRLKL